MSKITTLFKGEFVLVGLVDETIELTVENNVYSRSESLELLEEMKRACALDFEVITFSRLKLEAKRRIEDE